MALGNPPPCVARLNSGYNVLPDSEVGGNFILLSPVATDRSNSDFAKLAARVFRSPVCFTCLYRVLHIPGSSVPSQVLNDIVRSARIIVARIKGSISWAFKCRQNQTVYWVFFMATRAFAKAYVKIAVTGFGLLKWAAFHILRASRVVTNHPILTANISKVRCRVKSLVTGDWFPYFHNKPPLFMGHITAGKELTWD